MALDQATLAASHDAAKRSLRVMFLTNFYPPLGFGGYELWCQEMAQGLRARGHHVRVITSRHGQGGTPPPEANGIQRSLHLEMDFVSLTNAVRFFVDREKRELENLQQVRQLVDDQQPDVAVIWGMWNLPRAVAALAEALLPGRVVYYLADYWPTLPSQLELYWQAPARHWLTWLPKRLLGRYAHRVMRQAPRPELAFQHVLFCSQFLQDELRRLGLPMRETKVILGAVDVAAYAREAAGRNGATPQRDRLALLYVGRLEPDKGVHTAIEALAHLVHGRAFKTVRLQIVGSGKPDYVAQLRRMVQEAGISDCVHLAGPCTRKQLPQLYRQADVLVFPSIWQEPFGRVLVEAMAAGLVVVGTRTGGAAEILEDGVNCLSFEAGDSAGLAAQVLRLWQSPELRRRLRDNGRSTAQQRFDLPRMAAELEAYLLQVAAEHTRTVGG
jgi:glycosyltransferase involved in cell wall biosynthesis